MDNGFAVGDEVVLDLPDTPTLRALQRFNGMVCVVEEILDPDNDLYRVRMDDGDSTLEVVGSEIRLLDKGIG